MSPIAVYVSAAGGIAPPQEFSAFAAGGLSGFAAPAGPNVTYL
jgi:hypothetical protein